MACDCIGVVIGQGITAVLNLVNWWELVSKRPDIPELECYFGAENIVYQDFA